MPHVESIQVGPAREYPADHFVRRPLNSGIIKYPVETSVWVGRDRLVGDSEHGDLDRAVLGYSAEHYRDWRNSFPEFDFPVGSFGENLTIAGLSEKEVCVGDVHRIGGVMLQVTQPRYPCPKLSRRCGIDSLHKVAAETNRYGWLYKVIQEGYVETGLALKVLDRPNPQWPVSRAFGILRAAFHREPINTESAAELVALTELAGFWRDVVRQAL